MAANKDEKKDWKAIAAWEQQDRQARFPVKWLIQDEDLPSKEVLDVTQLIVERKWLEEEELAITGLSVVDLAAAIKERKYTALAVVEAFAHRATIAQQLVNPLTEINFEEAIKEARRLDDHVEKTGEVVGPMHGIPISVKDVYHVKGLDTTIGFCAWAGRIADRDSVVITCMKQAGAIILTKTNIGQALMGNESINHLFGRSLNPFNRSLTPAGSSGGEAALLAIRGAPIGLGTDHSGSIRSPAMCCGLYGLRPSWGRVSQKDISGVFMGLESRRCTSGPMGHSPEDLDLFMASYMASKPWEMDPEILRMPWQVEGVMPSGPLCFAVSYGDEDMTPHPPIMRGLRLVVEKLRKAGHTVVDWRGPLRTKDFIRIGDTLTLSGAKEDILAAIESTQEPIWPEIAEKFDLYGPEKAQATPYDIWQLHLEKQALIEWFHTTWQSTRGYSTTGRPIDGLILPINHCLAPPHLLDCDGTYTEARYGILDIASTTDYTSAAFPVGLRQDPEIDLPVQGFEAKTEYDQVLQDSYGDPEQWRGAPIGLQLVGQRLEEEKVLGMMGKIRDALEGSA